jgi:hypothetical protein
MTFSEGIAPAAEKAAQESRRGWQGMALNSGKVQGTRGLRRGERRELKAGGGVSYRDGLQEQQGAEA